MLLLSLQHSRTSIITTIATNESLSIRFSSETNLIHKSSLKIFYLLVSLHSAFNSSNNTQCTFSFTKIVINVTTAIRKILFDDMLMFRPASYSKLINKTVVNTTPSRNNDYYYICWSARRQDVLHLSPMLSFNSIKWHVNTYRVRRWTCEWTTFISSDVIS